jgi:transcriptional regulator with XRE-family HTH domain
MKGRIKINYLKVKDLIAEKKFSIEGFADAMGVTRNTMYVHLSKEFISYDVAMRIAKTLDVDISEIKDNGLTESEFVGFEEIKKMLENIISQQFETIKSQQQTIQTLAGVLGKRRVIMKKSKGQIVPLHYNQAA